MNDAYIDIMTTVPKANYFLYLFLTTILNLCDPFFCTYFNAACSFFLLAQLAQSISRFYDKIFAICAIFLDLKIFLTKLNQIRRF